MPSKKRRRNRGGRPRKDVERHPGGQVVQKVAKSIEERENKSVVVNARIRKGVAPEIADKPEGGKSLVLMLRSNGHKDSEIARYELAAEEFHRRWMDKCRFYPLLTPKPLKNYYDPSGYDDSDGADPDYVAASKRANANWKEAVEYITAHGERDSLQIMLDVIVDNRMVPPYQIGNIRSGLNAITRLLSSHRRAA